MLWPDSLRTQHRDLDAAGTSGRRHYEPRDVTVALEALTAVEHGTTRRVGELTVELFPAGHILGASRVRRARGHPGAWWCPGTCRRPPSTPSAGSICRTAPTGAHLLLIESTYAGQGRKRPRSVAVGEVVEAASAVAAVGGRLLVPAFAFGRAQELAMLFATELPGVDVLVDGLARDVAEVYEQHLSPSGTPIRIFGASVSPVPRGSTAQYIQQMTSGIVIATSGMLTGGPVVSWARTAPSRPGLGGHAGGFPAPRLRRIPSSARSPPPAPARSIFRRSTGSNGPVEVNALCRGPPARAHASEDELIEVIRDVTPDAVMPVHGTRQAQRALAERLARRGQVTVSPTSVWRAEPA